MTSSGVTVNGKLCNFTEKSVSVSFFHCISSSTEIKVFIAMSVVISLVLAQSSSLLKTFLFIQIFVKDKLNLLPLLLALSTDYIYF